MDSKKSVRVQWLEIGTSNRMTPPYNYAKLVEMACDRLKINDSVFYEERRAFYEDAFNNIEDIDNEDQMQLAISEAIQLLEISVDKRQTLSPQKSTTQANIEET